MAWYDMGLLPPVRPGAGSRARPRTPSYKVASQRSAASSSSSGHGINDTDASATPSVIISGWIHHGDRYLVPELWKYSLPPDETSECLNLREKLWALDLDLQRFVIVGGRSFLLGRKSDDDLVWNTCVEVFIWVPVGPSSALSIAIRCSVLVLTFFFLYLCTNIVYLPFTLDRKIVDINKAPRPKFIKIQTSATAVMTKNRNWSVLALTNNWLVSTPREKATHNHQLHNFMLNAPSTDFFQATNFIIFLLENYDGALPPWHLVPFVWPRHNSPQSLHQCWRLLTLRLPLFFSLKTKPRIQTWGAAQEQATNVIPRLKNKLVTVVLLRICHLFYLSNPVESPVQWSHVLCGNF